MSGSSFGPKTTGGTVYSGPNPAATTTGTVYGGGPAPGGTVYNSAAAAQPRPTAGTAAAQGSPAGARGARIFFLIAAFTGINVVMMFAGIRFGIGLSTTSMSDVSLNTMLALSVLGAGIFVALGMFARNGNKAAFLIGMPLYAADLVLLVLNHPEIHVISIVIHALFLFYLFSAFRQLPE